jgi:hypothetical protein
VLARESISKEYHGLIPLGGATWHFEEDFQELLNRAVQQEFTEMFAENGDSSGMIGNALQTQNRKGVQEQV